MKRFNLHYLLAAAALTVAANGASAQILKAEIPFTFHAGKALMDPGAYQVKMPEGSSPYIILKNLDTGKAILEVYNSPEEDRRGKAGNARLTFACAGARCVLQQVWPGGAARGYNFSAPKLPNGEALVSREIPLTKASTN